MWPKLKKMNPNVTKLKNSKCDKTQILKIRRFKMWQNSNTQNFTKFKLKVWKNSVNSKFKNSKCDKTQKLKMWQKFKNSKCDKT